jgi:hypothetical protein
MGGTDGESFMNNDLSLPGLNPKRRRITRRNYGGLNVNKLNEIK